MQKQLEALRKGWDAAGLVLGKVADAVAEEGAGLLASSKALKAYQLGHPVATCGPGDLWAIYTATSKKPGAIFKDVCIWFLDKRRLYESNKQTAKPRCFDTLLDQQRKSCQHMARLKHPGVVKVIEPLEETATQMVLVTEPIMGSLRNITSHFSSVPGAAAEVKQAVLSPLELKLGLVMLTDTLTFLGSDAGLAHCGLTPQVVLVTTDGSWKLAGFTFSVATDYASAAAAAAQPAWTYNDPFPPMWDELAKPSLPYSAPELVGGWGGAQSSLPSSALSPAADVFSLAALAYELLSGSGQQLLPVRNSLTEYKAAVLPAGLGGQQGLQAVLASAPPLLQEVLRGMLAPLPSSRPAPAAFTASPFFQEDLLLRALRFLDTLLQRETGQKLAFLKDLSQLWTQLDDRLLRLRVLPALIQELRHEALQPVALPLVLSMLPRVTPAHFASQLLPLLKPLMEGAQGELLGGLMAGSAVLAQLMTQEQVGSYLVPLFARALDGQAGPAVIEECCKALQDCIGTLDYTLLKAELVPRLHAACMRTTSGSVRVYTLTLMAKVVGRLDREEANKIIDTAAQVVAVDRSASTLVCTAGLVDALSKQWGAEVTAGRLLPLLCPLLVAPSLSSRQFAELLATTQSMLSRIQAKMAPDSKSAFGQEAVQRSGAQLQAPAGEAAHSHMAPAWDTPLTGPTSHMKSRNPGSQAPPAPAPQPLPAWVPLSIAPPTLGASGPAGGPRPASGAAGPPGGARAGAGAGAGSGAAGPPPPIPSPTWAATAGSSSSSSSSQARHPPLSSTSLLTSWGATPAGPPASSLVPPAPASSLAAPVAGTQAHSAWQGMAGRGGQAPLQPPLQPPQGSAPADMFGGLQLAAAPSGPPSPLDSPPQVVPSHTHTMPGHTFTAAAAWGAPTTSLHGGSRGGGPAAGAGAGAGGGLGGVGGVGLSGLTSVTSGPLAGNDAFASLASLAMQMPAVRAPPPSSAATPPPLPPPPPKPATSADPFSMLAAAPAAQAYSAPPLPQHHANGYTWPGGVPAGAVAGGTAAAGGAAAGAAAGGGGGTRLGHGMHVPMLQPPRSASSSVQAVVASSSSQKQDLADLLG